MGFYFLFKRGQKVARWQPSILQNYNPMNISKFEPGTFTGLVIALSIDDTIIRRSETLDKYKKPYLLRGKILD